MNAIYEYTILIAALAILCALFEFLIPQGRLKQAVRLAIGLLFLIGIATPLTQLLRTGRMNLPALTWEEQAPALEQPGYDELLRGYYERILEE